VTQSVGSPWGVSGQRAKTLLKEGIAGANYTQGGSVQGVTLIADDGQEFRAMLSLLPSAGDRLYIKAGPLREEVRYTVTQVNIHLEGSLNVSITSISIMLTRD
jgi:hypothetical protein